MITETVVTDNSTGTPQSVTTPYNVSIEVFGIADVPETANLTVIADEDTNIELGQAISTEIGNVTNLLVDQDGSETPYLILSNVPPGVIPTVDTAIPNGINYLGSGKWQISADAVPSLELPPVENFSG